MKYILLTFLLALGACGTKQKEEKASTVPVSVEGTTVRALQPSKTLTLPGELYSWNKVSIYPKVKGFVKSVLADRGTKVRKGQVLAIMEAPETLSELDQAKGQLSAAEALFLEKKASFSASKYAYNRLQKASATKGAISQHELELAEARMLGDSAAVFTAQGNLNAARSHYNTKAEFVHYLTITAPFDGVIVERNVSPGALIGAADGNAKPMFVLEDNSVLRLTVAIPETYSNALHKKSNVQFSVNAIPNQSFEAGFGRSSESIVEKTRVMMTEFDVPNKTNVLKNGMYAEVKLPIVRTTETLFVPKTAVVSSSEDVFIIRSKNNKAEWVSVQKGIVLDSLVEIFGDVKKDDRIVKEASEEIREGEKLELR